ncbi:MAG: zinc dependent phospholipase C family protein [Peptococcaceae bacterium]|nr:zinc dependent phospholipase C family protein [Peptococcaceae bacterium]
MRVGNHYKIGRLICKKMAENNMLLNKPAFILGNLAPDLFFSFLYRPHLRASSAPHLNRLLGRLYNGSMTPDQLRFSYCLGKMTHYVCDFFCYAHTPSFKGTAREHILYEKNQTVRAKDMPIFSKQSSINRDFADLTNTLDSFITRNEQLLAQDVDMAVADIPLAIHAATWAASAAFLYAENMSLNVSMKETVVAEC